MKTTHLLMLAGLCLTACGRAIGAATPPPTFTDAVPEVATATDVVVLPAPPTTAAAPTPQATVSATAVPPTATDRPMALTHTVRPGENLFRIGLRYGVTVEALRVANGLTGDTIYAGQVLVIPPASGSINRSPTAQPTLAPTAMSTVCAPAWFFNPPPPGCPTTSLQSSAAFQPFERGQMIWLSRIGRYFILEDSPLYPNDVRRQADFVHDPLNIVRDTSGQVAAPAGRYAPVSGFGLVWRGDLEGGHGYRERLGWAVEPERGYAADFQCDDARPSGGMNWQMCYLLSPDGRVIVLHPLGGWYWLGER